MDDLSLEQSDPPPSETIGMATLLRRAREQRGLTLEQVAHETKVSVERLAALEREVQPHTNRGFYQRAHIRAFARAVDLDERVVLAELKRESIPEPLPVQEPLPVRTPPPQGHHGVLLVVSAVLVAGLSGVVWNAAARGTDDRAVPIAAFSEPEPHAEPTTGTMPAVVHASPQVAEAPSLIAEAPSLVAEATPVVAVVAVGTREPEVGTLSPTTGALTELVITTDPVDARVAVNGIGWGTTPITIQHLAPGEKRLRVTKDGYIAAERVTNVVQNRSMTVNIKLEPAP